LTEPEEADRNSGCSLGRGLALAGGDLTPGDVDLFLQGEPGGAAGPGLAGRALIERLDATDSAALSRRMEDHGIAHRQPAALDRSGDDAAVVPLSGELVDVLHRHPERLLDRTWLGVEAIQHLQRRRAAIPVHRDGPPGQVVTVGAAHRDEARGHDAHLGEEAAELSRE